MSATRDSTTAVRMHTAITLREDLTVTAKQDSLEITALVRLFELLKVPSHINVLVIYFIMEQLKLYSATAL